MSLRVAFETLGCKLNQYETDAIAAGFRELGWEIVDTSTQAEAYVVNTCTVTNKADRKSFHTLGRHRQHPHRPVVVVTGCFAESARDSLEGQEGVTFVVPNAKKNQIPALVDAHLRGEVSAPTLPDPDVFGFPVHEKVFHTRASVKIQDGCDNFCSFCIIPSVRGRAVSRPMAQVLEAARTLVAGGRKELVLTGVNMGRWRHDEADFTDLVRALLGLEGDFRLRITSLEPEGLGEAFADLLTHPKFCPHLHLCLQSASPRILLTMRREYNLDQYIQMAALFRKRRPDLNLTTDLIVGFPGESDLEFEKTLAAIEVIGFGFAHVFPYSRRQGTRAERMPEQIPEPLKVERSRRLQQKVTEVRRTRMAALRGHKRRILVETPGTERSEKVWLRGLTEDYFPVRFQGKAGWNTFVDVTLETLEEESGELVFGAKIIPSPPSPGRQHPL